MPASIVAMPTSPLETASNAPLTMSAIDPSIAISYSRTSAATEGYRWAGSGSRARTSTFATRSESRAT